MDYQKRALSLAEEIDAKLEIIKAKVHAKADKAQHWAHVGDLNHVLELVEEIDGFLR